MQIYLKTSIFKNYPVNYDAYVLLESKYSVKKLGEPKHKLTVARNDTEVKCEISDLGGIQRSSKQHHVNEEYQKVKFVNLKDLVVYMLVAWSWIRVLLMSPLGRLDFNWEVKMFSVKSYIGSIPHGESRFA